MVEWIVSSSVLIAVVLLLRSVLKGKISLRLQYALWTLVLVRLMVPVSFGDTALSVGNLTQKAAASEPAQVVSALSETELPRMSYQAAYNEVAREYADRGIRIEEMPLEEYAETVDYEIMNRMNGDLSVGEVVRIVWLCGIALVGAWFAISNLRLLHSLKKTRTLLSRDHALPVYLSDAIDTPCLFGLFHPAIYLTGEAIESEHTQRHAIEHEVTHFRHKDNIWAILRGVCLAIHWFNPLVWCAAVLSRNDAELACDESTILRLGERERAAYGRTLISLTCEKRSALLNTATTMTGSGKSIEERIALIVKKPKMALYTVIAVAVIAAVAVGCTFTGAKEAPSADDVPAIDPGTVQSPTSFDENRPMENTIPKDTAQGSDETLNREEIRNKLYAVMTGESVFYETNLKKPIYIRDLKQTVSTDDVTVEISRFAVLDLDGDGAEEAVLWLIVNGNYYYGCEVLRCQEGEVYGYLMWYRAMNSLKDDSTFRFSGGASDHGFGRLRFDGQTYHVEKTAYCESVTEAGEPVTVSFYVNGQKVSQEDFDLAAQAQDEKAEAAWYDFTDENISAVLAVGRPALDAAGEVIPPMDIRNVINNILVGSLSYDETWQSGGTYMLTISSADGRSDTYSYLPGAFYSLQSTPGYWVDEMYDWSMAEDAWGDDFENSDYVLTLANDQYAVTVYSDESKLKIELADGSAAYFLGTPRTADEYASIHEYERLFLYFRTHAMSALEAHELYACSVDGSETDYAVIARELSEQYARLIPDRPGWYHQRAEDAKVGAAEVFDAYYGEDNPNFCFRMGLHLKMPEEQTHYWQAGAGLSDPPASGEFAGYYGYGSEVGVRKSEDGRWRMNGFASGGSWAHLPVAPEEATAERLMELFFLTSGFSRDWRILSAIVECPMEEIRAQLETLDTRQLQEFLSGLKTFAEENPDSCTWSPDDLQTP